MGRLLFLFLWGGKFSYQIGIYLCNEKLIIKNEKLRKGSALTRIIYSETAGIIIKMRLQPPL